MPFPISYKAVGSRLGVDPALLSITSFFPSVGGGGSKPGDGGEED